jgi:hypothetical protein
MFSLQIDMGGKKESVKLAAFRQEMIPALIRGINKGAAIMEREVKHQLSLGGTMPRGRANRARSLGFSRTSRLVPRWIPNMGIHLRVMDGTLRASWRMFNAKRIPGGVEGGLTTRSPYARIHEYGGNAGRNHATHIIPRPYVKPAIKTVGDQVVTTIVAELVAPLKAAG